MLHLKIRMAFSVTGQDNVSRRFKDEKLCNSNKDYFVTPQSHASFVVSKLLMIIEDKHSSKLL